MKVFEDGRSKTLGILEHAEKAALEVFSLPTEPLMKAEDSAYVIDAVKRVFV
jgi:dTDP-4-amino-4,6-dideoxygalactose transaminase